MSKNLTRTSAFSRVLAFFLACILTVGLVAQVAPAAKAIDTSKVPDTLQLDHVGYGLDGKLSTSEAEGATYSSPVLGGCTGAVL